MCFGVFLIILELTPLQSFIQNLSQYLSEENFSTLQHHVILMQIQFVIRYTHHTLSGSCWTNASIRHFIWAFFFPKYSAYLLTFTELHLTVFKHPLQLIKIIFKADLLPRAYRQLPSRALFSCPERVVSSSSKSLTQTMASTGAQTGPHWLPLSLWKFPHSPWLLNPYLHPLTPFRPCSLTLDPLNGKWGGGKGEGIRTTHYLSCPTPVTLNVCCQGAKQYSPSLCATVDWDIANSITKAWSMIY